MRLPGFQFHGCHLRLGADEVDHERYVTPITVKEGTKDALRRPGHGERSMLPHGWLPGREKDGRTSTHHPTPATLPHPTPYALRIFTSCTNIITSWLAGSCGGRERDYYRVSGLRCNYYYFPLSLACNYRRRIIACLLACMRERETSWRRPRDSTKCICN